MRLNEARCGGFGPPLSKETQSDQRFTALTGTEAVKSLIGRCTCINQDGETGGREGWLSRAGLGPERARYRRRRAEHHGGDCRLDQRQAPASHTSSRHCGHA
jgi:hypothetical protein